MNIYTIYRITNKINNKVYIGYTSKTALTRFNQHVQSSKRNNNNNNNNILSKSMRKHGSEQFFVDVIFQSADLSYTKTEMEEYFIREYNSHFLDGVGYNMTYGGDGGDTSESPNYRIGMSNRNISGEHNPNWNKDFTVETRQKMSAAKLGKRPPNFDVWSQSQKGKSFYHDATIKLEQRFHPEDIPANWTKGRLKLQCSCGKFVDRCNMARYHKDC